MAEYRGTIYDFADTKKMRGAWKLMMVIAAKADSSTIKEKKIVCGQIRTFQQFFKCNECKEHFGEYLLTNPPEEQINKEDGLFKWVVKFMNSVALRKRKHQYDYEILYKMFHISTFGLCTGPENTNTKETMSSGVPSFKEVKHPGGDNHIRHTYTPENTRITHGSLRDINM